MGVQGFQTILVEIKRRPDKRPRCTVCLSLNGRVGLQCYNVQDGDLIQNTSIGHLLNYSQDCITWRVLILKLTQPLLGTRTGPHLLLSSTRGWKMRVTQYVIRTRGSPSRDFLLQRNAILHFGSIGSNEVSREPNSQNALVYQEISALETSSVLPLEKLPLLRRQGNSGCPPVN